jgi:putative ABC transport system permease protein
MNRRKSMMEDLDHDVRDFIERETQDNIERGMPPEEARYAALRKFGSVTRVREDTRQVWSFGWLEQLGQDIRYGLRQLRRNPGFTAVAILTLALGIGATTAIFTVVRSVLLKPLAYADPGRLVMVTGGATAERFAEIKTAARSFTALGAYAVGMENATLSGVAVPEALNAARVSANFLEVLGVKPLLGRSFLPEEDSPSARPVAMISAGLWRRQFNSDYQIAGKTVALNSTAYTIIGVLPLHFEFPFEGEDVWVTRPDEWSPVPAKSRPLSPILAVFGRLRPHVSLDQASAEMAVINGQYAYAYPAMLDAKPNSPEAVTPLKDSLVTDICAKLWMLFGAVVFVLLIACANVASLLLARAAFRTREFAVRTALGAARGRLIAQSLAESILLALSGGAAGVLLAVWSLRAFTGLADLDLPRASEIRPDGMVLGFAIGLTIVTGVLFGLLPALATSRPDLIRGLRAGGEAATSSGVKPTLRLSPRGLLVAGQVALSVVLLIGATLLMESLVRAHSVSPGFQPAKLLTLKIALPPGRYDTDQKKAAFFEEVVSREESLPGVRSAAVTLTLPMTGFAGSPVQVVEQPPERLNQRPIAVFQSITPDYFRTLAIPLRRGREFKARDRADSLPVAIISESLARRFWPAYPQGPDPIGQHILVGSKPQALEIVGVVADVHQASLEIDVRPGVYRPWVQAPLQTAMLAVRTPGEPLGFVNAVRSQILAVDRDQPVSAVQTMDEIVERSLGELRLIMLLMAAFAAVALLLAVVGIYGVLAYLVAHRTPEIGIRRALGARHSDILALVVGQGLGLALIGVAVGTAAALALTRVIRDLLFQVGSSDARTFVGIALLFVAVALLASLIPARRATKVDPMVALRYE